MFFLIEVEKGKINIDEWFPTTKFIKWFGESNLIEFLDRKPFFPEKFVKDFKVCLEDRIMQNEYFHGAQITKFLLFEMENKFFEDETNFFVNFASGDFNEKRPTYFREKDKRDNFYKSINEHIYGVYGDELKKLPTENSKIDLPVEIKNIKEKFIFLILNK